MRMIALIGLSVFLLGTLPADAQSTPPTQGSRGVIGDIADIVFNEVERRAIEEYYDRVPVARNEDDDKGKKDKSWKGKGRGDGLPPGLAKRDQLPPGLAKRGNRLPPGLMKGDLPQDLESRLPPLPRNVERVIVDTDVLLIEKGTDIILDVLKGVITNQ